MTSFLPQAWKAIRTWGAKAISAAMHAITVAGFIPTMKRVSSRRRDASAKALDPNV